MMGLPWLLALELVLHAGSFMCGVITAASVTITQVQLIYPYIYKLTPFISTAILLGEKVLQGLVHELLYYSIVPFVIWLSF